MTVEGLVEESVAFDVYYGHEGLYFLVENTGRINYGSLIGDRKVNSLCQLSVQYLMALFLFCVKGYCWKCHI